MATKNGAGKDWTKKFGGGDPNKLLAFKAATSVRSSKEGTVLLSKFVSRAAQRAKVADVLRADYAERVKVTKVRNGDYKVARAA